LELLAKRNLEFIPAPPKIAENTFILKNAFIYFVTKPQEEEHFALQFEGGRLKRHRHDLKALPERAYASE